MIIAIEGMDGSGKTTISKIISEKTGYEYMEKPLKNYLQLSDLEYENLCQKIYLLNDDLKAIFFGFSNLLGVQLKNKNIILDKHILSTYFWNNTEINDIFFNFLVDIGVFPDLTIILYSSVENRIRHIKERSVDDKDLLNEKKLSLGYDKMLCLAEKSGAPYVFINGDDLSFNEIVDRIIKVIDKCSNLTKEDIAKYCKSINAEEFRNNVKIRKLCFRGEINNEEGR